MTTLLWLFVVVVAVFPHGSFFLLDHDGYLLKENSCSDPFYTSLLPFLTSKLSFSRLYCSSHPLCPLPNSSSFTFTATLGFKIRAFYRLGVCPATGLGSILPKVASWATESWVCATRQGALIFSFLWPGSSGALFWVWTVLLWTVYFVLGDEFYSFYVSQADGSSLVLC